MGFFGYSDNQLLSTNMTDISNSSIDPCPSCGRPTPVGTRCVYCSTLTDLDLNNLPLDQMRTVEADTAEEGVPRSVVLVEKTGLKMPLRGLKMKIGRDPSNQLVVKEDTYASRHHAWITYEDGDFWIEDLGSDKRHPAKWAPGC